MTQAGRLEDLGQRLKLIARQRTELDVAQMQIINLDAVRLAFGLKWQDVRERVFEAATSFLRNRIMPEDLLVPCGNGFVVVFGSIDGASAEIAGLQLARALNQFFLGEQGAGAFKVGCKHETLELAAIANLVNALGTLDPTLPVYGTLAASDETNVRFKFLPQWDIKNEAISIYVVSPYDANGNSLVTSDHNPLDVSLRRDCLERDMRMIEASITALNKLLNYGDQAIIDMRLHAATLADTSQRREILEALTAIDPRLKRYLMVTIGDVVPGFPRYHLDEIVHLIAQKVERVGVCLPYDDTDLDWVAASAVWGFGYHLPRLGPASSSETADAIQSRLQRDAKHAHRHGKRLIVAVHGSAHVVQWCRNAGADLVTSKALWPALDAPRGVERYELPKPEAA